jgi:hydroxyethylthiazole kinase-like uncharacterized protein yjeF
MGPLTRQQVRAVDRFAIECLGVPGVVLMENAGRNAAQVLAERFAPITDKAVLIVAGKGNNGGDGYVIARHLSRMGAHAKTILTCPSSAVAGDAKTNLDILHRLGLAVAVCETPAQAAELLDEADVIVEALGGTGISGPLSSELAAWVDAINAAPAAVVAVDIPTGLDCDTGQAAGPAIRADMTVTFVSKKAGFDRKSSTQYTGPVVTVDIGVDAGAIVSQLPSTGLGRGENR